MAFCDSESFKVGDRVFAKIRGYQHWPAQVTERIEGPNEEYCVAFYGTHEIAYVKPPMMCHYNDESIGKYASPSVTTSKKRKPTRSHVLMLQKAMEECAAALNFIPFDVDESNNTGMPELMEESVSDESEAGSRGGDKDKILEKTPPPDPAIPKRGRPPKPKAAANVQMQPDKNYKIPSDAVTPLNDRDDQVKPPISNKTFTPKSGGSALGIPTREQIEQDEPIEEDDALISTASDANMNTTGSLLVSRSSRKIKLKKFADEMSSSPLSDHLKATLKPAKESSPKKRKASLDENVPHAKKSSMDPETMEKPTYAVKRQKSFSTDDQAKSIPMVPLVEPPLGFAKKSVPVLEENPILEPSSVTDTDKAKTPEQLERPRGRPSKNRFLTTKAPVSPSSPQLPASISWKIEAMKPLQDKLITSCKLLESLHAKDGSTSLINAPVREKLVSLTPTSAAISAAAAMIPPAPTTGSTSKSMDAIAKIIAGNSSKKINIPSPSSAVKSNTSVVYARKSSASIETQTVPAKIITNSDEQERTLSTLSPVIDVASTAISKVKDTVEPKQDISPTVHNNKTPTVEMEFKPNTDSESGVLIGTNVAPVKDSNETAVEQATETVLTATPSGVLNSVDLMEKGTIQRTNEIKKPKETDVEPVLPEKNPTLSFGSDGNTTQLEVKQHKSGIIKKSRPTTPDAKQEESATEVKQHTPGILKKRRLTTPDTKKEEIATEVKQHTPGMLNNPRITTPPTKKEENAEVKQHTPGIVKKPRLTTADTKKEENATGRTHLHRKIDLSKRYQETNAMLPFSSPTTDVGKLPKVNNSLKKLESPVAKSKAVLPLTNGTLEAKQKIEGRLNGLKIEKSPKKVERRRSRSTSAPVNGKPNITEDSSSESEDDNNMQMDITESDFPDEQAKEKFRTQRKAKEVMETVVTLIDSSLLNKHDCDVALEMINKLGSPNFVDEVILNKSHPEIVEVLRKMQHFVGNPKGNRYNKAQKLELEEKSTQIRQAAVKTLDSLKELMSTNTKPRAVLIMEEMRRQQNDQV